MPRRFLFEPLDIAQLAAPRIDDIDIELTAMQIRQFRASGSKRSYNPAIAHAEGFASGKTSLAVALASFDGIEPDWWQGHLRAVTELLSRTLSNNGSLWRPLGRKPIEVFDGIWFKPAIRGVWKTAERRDAALINPRIGIHLHPLRLSFLARSIIEFHMRDEPNLSGLSILDYGRHETEKRRLDRVLHEGHVDIMEEHLFIETLKRFVMAARLADAELVPRESQRIRDLFRMPRFKWDH